MFSLCGDIGNVIHDARENALYVSHERENEEEHRDSMKRMSKTRTFPPRSRPEAFRRKTRELKRKDFSAEAATTSTEEEMVETDVQTAKKDETKMKKSAASRTCWRT